MGILLKSLLNPTFDDYTATVIGATMGPTVLDMLKSMIKRGLIKPQATAETIKEVITPLSQIPEMLKAYVADACELIDEKVSKALKSITDAAKEKVEEAVEKIEAPAETTAEPAPQPEQPK